jgi:hypothetical protein
VKLDSQPRKDGAASRPLLDCLNPQCSEKHSLFDCANTSEQDKKTLRKACYDGKKEDSASKPAACPCAQRQTFDSRAKAEEKRSGNVRRTRAASLDEGHISPLLADVCAVKVLADGADDNVMSRLTSRHLSVAGLFFSTKRLESTITLQLTAKEMTASAVEKARVNITMQLDAGPLRRRNVEALRHYKHGSVENHADVSQIPSIPIGEDADVEIAEALAKRVEVAVENGLSVLGAAELRRLLKQYECDFALKLGPQPPCAFPPLVVKMPADVKPVRARAHSYARSQTAICSLRDGCTGKIRYDILEPDVGMGTSCARRAEAWRIAVPPDGGSPAEKCLAKAVRLSYAAPCKCAAKAAGNSGVCDL